MSQQTTIQSLQSFKFVNQLSRGKYPVYKALANQHLNKQVALKVFPDNKSDLANFEVEKDLLSLLSHNNIINMVESKSESGINYIALEFAKHGDLFEILLKGSAMSEKLARTVFKKIVGAIEYMHSQKIAHLDLKPENILLDENLEIKVTDFDLSLNYSQENASLGLRRGTPGYRAPEVADGSCKNFLAADVYSLGALLFLLVNRNPAYNEKKIEGKYVFDQFYKLMRADNKKFWAVHMRHRAEKFSEEIMDLITSMMCEKPEQRASLEEIKCHEWFNMEVFEDEEYKTEMKAYIALAGKF